MSDKTNFAQSLMHMIKGNLGTGILAMPASFAHCGLINAIIGLPLLCLIATYCVHLLVRSSQHLENKMKWLNMEYAELAKGSFKAGPSWMKRYSGAMCFLVDAVLIISQIGICCCYLVFIVRNLYTILATYHIIVHINYLFIAILPFVLLISYIRTLNRLSIASACANVLQVVGISIVIEYLIRDTQEVREISYFKPISEVALGFGSAMFAFEGISVVMPIYTRMKRPEQMGGVFGAINVSYFLLLILYFTVGIFGYLRYGNGALDSITLNLPKEPLYDVVRAIFTLSLFLTYPLQLYVPNEIIWNWAQAKLLESTGGPDGRDAGNAKTKPQEQKVVYEYFCRTILVLVTFALAMTIPKLNLMMDLVGSISGTALSVILPPIIHIAAFWEDTSGSSRIFMVLVDGILIVVGLLASASGSYFSFTEIVRSFSDPISGAHGVGVGNHQLHSLMDPMANLTTMAH